MRYSLVVSTLLFSAWYAAAAAPNIVMIVSDDHGWEDYGFMGHKQIQTPRLDQLAKESLTFKRGYSVTSLCCPSLATMLTGRYPHQNMIANNDPPKRGLTPKELRLDPLYAKQRQQMIQNIEAVPTLPRLLRDKGYVSFQTGKWWQGHYSTGGFTAGMSHGDASKGGRHGDEGLDIGRKTMKPMFDFMDTAKKEEKPFFVWYAPMLPHQPHNPPDRLLKKYQNKTKSIHEAKYYAMVEWFDETCGQLLDYLDQAKLSDNTIVVYVTDNGWIQDPEAAKPMRSKLTPYDAGHRTPIMIRWPGKVKPEFSSALASAVDLTPTLLNAVGLKPDAQMSGIDLLIAEQRQKRQAIFGECFTHDAVELEKPEKSLRFRWTVAGEWRLLVPHSAQEPKAKAELYHITADPYEKQNLIEKEPRKAEELQGLLDAWWKP
jgi:arylsulfatase A-like enzyme